jgi:uncharacterized protein (TIGR03083 family)
MAARRRDGYHHCHETQFPVKEPSMSNKETLLQKLDSGFAAFKETLAGLSDGQMSQPWLGEWGVKDILAHVAGWHVEMTGALERMGRGERPTPEGVDWSDSDAWNAKFTAARKTAPVASVLSELEDSFARYRAATAALPEDRFEPGRTVDRLIHTSGVNHYIEHGDQIREWRRKQ